MSESQSESTPSSAEGIPQRPTLRDRLRRPFVRSAAVFLIGLILDKLIKLVSPDSIERLSEFNTQLAAGAKSVQPWYGAALFWQKLTSNWPADVTPAGTPFFLLGRVVGAGLETIFLPLSEGPETALPALVGYGLGFYIVHKVYEYRGKELNLLAAIVGTILIGGVCLFILQPVMIMATGIFGLILGSVSTNAIVLATIVPLAPVGGELIKHILEERAEAVLDKALDAPGPQSEGKLPEMSGNAEKQIDQGNELTASQGIERPVSINRPDGKAPLNGLGKRRFALEPVTQKLTILLSALGLVFVFGGTVAIFYDSMIISIPLILLGLVLLIYLAPKTGACLRWKNIEEAKQSEFFRWFSLMETRSAKDERGRQIVTFRPDGDKFRDMVSLDVVLHEDGKIAVAHLSLARAFVEDEIDGIFARDIAKSFIRAAIPAIDEGSVTDLANDIEYRHNYSVITGIAASDRPQLPSQPTPGFMAFVGSQQLYEGTFSNSRIRIEQVNTETDPTVGISIGAGC